MGHRAFLRAGSLRSSYCDRSQLQPEYSCTRVQAPLPLALRRCRSATSRTARWRKAGWTSRSTTATRLRRRRATASRLRARRRPAAAPPART
eukprot:6737247-Prymnesium_polylepis.1